MTSALATVALLCCALSSPHWRRHGPAAAVEAFVTPPLAANHNADTAAAALGSVRRPSRGRVQSPAAATAAAARQGNRRFSRHGEPQPPQQQQPLAMSSQLNGADVSEDLSQLNGAAAAATPVPSQNTARVSVSPFRNKNTHVCDVCAHPHRVSYACRCWRVCLLLCGFSVLESLRWPLLPFLHVAVFLRELWSASRRMVCTRWLV